MGVAVECVCVAVSMFTSAVDSFKLAGDDTCRFLVLSGGAGVSLDGVGGAVLVVETTEAEMRDSTRARVAFALRV